MIIQTLIISILVCVCWAVGMTSYSNGDDPNTGKGSGPLLVLEGNLYSKNRQADIVVWNIATGVRVRVLNGHSGIVRDILYDPASDCIFSGSSDGTIRQWARSDGTFIRSYGVLSPIHRIGIYGGNVIAASEDRRITKFRISSGSETLRRSFVLADGYPLGLEVYGDYLIALTSAGVIRKLHAGNLTTVGTAIGIGPVNGKELVISGNLIIAAASNGDSFVYDVSTATPTYIRSLTAILASIWSACTFNGQYFTGHDNGQMFQFDIASGNIVRELTPSHTYAVNMMTCSHIHVFSGSDDDVSLRKWSIPENCPSNSQCLADRYNCYAGYQDVNEQCIPCMAGYYKSTAGSGSCIQCPDGQTSTASATVCYNIPRKTTTFSTSRFSTSTFVSKTQSTVSRLSTTISSLRISDSSSPAPAQADILETELPSINSVSLISTVANDASNLFKTENMLSDSTTEMHLFSVIISENANSKSTRKWETRKPSANSLVGKDWLPFKISTLFWLTSIGMLFVIIGLIQICIVRSRRRKLADSTSFSARVSSSLGTVTFEATKSSSALESTSYDLTATANNSGIIAIPSFLECQIGPDFMTKDLVAFGGGGQIYLGHAFLKSLTAYGPSIIVKIVNPQPSSAKGIDGFNQELALLYALSNSPNIVKLLGFCTAPYSILLKRYPLGNIWEWLQRKDIALNVRILHSFAKDIARGVQGIHQNGIIHCDLKPANILIDAVPGSLWPTCVITDFGIARINDSKNMLVPAFRVKVTVGASLQYASPESLAALNSTLQFSSTVTFSTDLYSYAVTLCEIMTRKRAYRK
eukprot:Partr_v1_DN28859_c1_g1_i2_m32969 putative protein kinase kinase kinase